MAAAAVQVPAGIGEVTPQWLSTVLAADGTVPATVTAIRAERIALDTGFSSLLYRVHLTGDSGVPASVIVKLPAESEARGAMEMMGGYTREVQFYRRVAGRAPIGTPHCYAALTAPDSADFVLVLQDLRDWDNADQLAGLSLDRARRCIAELAALHAWSAEPVNTAALQGFPSLDTSMTRELLPSVFGAGWSVYREHTQAPVPAAVAAFAERFAEHAPAALRALTERPMLIHGDIRADNLFFTGEQLKVVDFQLAARGVGATDIGYLISQGLSAADRSGRDEALLREYLDLLADRGVTDYTFDAAWRHYRYAVAYLMVLPVVILVTWETLEPRSRRLCVTLIDRAVAAIDETDALAVFG